MLYKEGQRTLIGFLAMPTVTKLVKTRLIGGPYVRFYNLCEFLSYLYTTAAILGRARRNIILVKMLSIPGTEEKVMVWLQRQAEQRLIKFKIEVGKEPDTFTEFIWAKYERLVESQH